MLMITSYMLRISFGLFRIEHALSMSPNGRAAYICFVLRRALRSRRAPVLAPLDRLFVASAQRILCRCCVQTGSEFPFVCVKLCGCFRVLVRSVVNFEDDRFVPSSLKQYQLPLTTILQCIESICHVDDNIVHAPNILWTVSN